MRNAAFLAPLATFLLCQWQPAVAQDAAPPGDTSQPATPPQQGGASSSSSHDGDFATRDVLTGDWGGERSTLENDGVVFAPDSIDEVLGNPTGGTRHGTIYDGRLELVANLDLEKLLGWSGATFHVNAYQIHGTGLSHNNLGDNLLTASNIEALRSTRLFDLWVEQGFRNGTLTVRAGQIAADDEFFTSLYAGTFINATFGWPASVGTDLPSGGPAYPLATPGVRVKYAATDALSVSLGLFNGNSAGPSAQDPQLADPSGTSFRFGDNTFLIGEANYAVNQTPDAKGLPASYKLGVWLHSARFADERFDTTGLSLASPGSNGIATLHLDDAGGYLVIDQALWQEGGDNGRSLGVFLRLSGAPDDRNEVDFYGDVGINLLGFIPGRSSDVLGIAAAVAHVGARTQLLQEDFERFSGVDTPVYSAESLIELTYRFQVAPWWQIQPDVQLVRHPVGAATTSGAPLGNRQIPSATILGIRSSILL